MSASTQKHVKCVPGRADYHLALALPLLAAAGTGDEGRST